MKIYSCTRLSVAMVLIVVVCTAGGCAPKAESYDTLVIDRPTPQGTVPPPAEPAPAPEPYRPYADRQSPPPASAYTVASAGNAALFAKKCASGRAPRMAVYVNRRLASSPREWEPVQRASAHYTEETKKNEEGKTKEKSTDATLTVSRDARRIEVVGVLLEQNWAWRFEDAIKGPFINAGAAVIDRDMMMRLAGADTTTPDNANIKSIETEGLRGKADILTQIEISLQPEPYRGFLYRIKAVEVATGKTLAAFNSMSWPMSRNTQGEYVPSPGGGYVQAPYPNPELVGGWIANDLMAALGPKL